MKRIYKYATGDSPPEGAIYLSTVTQTSVEGRKAIRGSMGIDEYMSEWEPCWLVWHYFLVEVSS